MKPDYKNWMPKGMVIGFLCGAIACLILFLINVTNVQFQSGNALKLDFPDESFDAVMSNYVYRS